MASDEQSSRWRRLRGRADGAMTRALPWRRRSAPADGESRGRGEGRSSRGSAELSVVVVAASLVAGMAFGDGLSRTVVDIADGLSWISDDPSGRVIQVNPATGEPVTALSGLGGPGDDLDVSQADGSLFVTNRTTGEVFSIDLAQVLVAGQRRVSAGASSEILLHQGAVYLVDRKVGTIARVDPTTTDAIGELWVAQEGLADATIDGEGMVWALETDGTLHQLRWSDGQRSFVTEDERGIDYSGSGSLLVGHDRGVTVFGPEAGIVVQVGTGDDVVTDAPALAGKIAVPASSPGNLAPASVAEAGLVVIVGADTVREVDVAGIGCPKPGRPAVHRNLVYVPCDGSGRVIVLDGEGRRAAQDIAIPGERDAELVVDDGNLLINVPGSRAGLIVRADGRLVDLTRYSDDTPDKDLNAISNGPSNQQIADRASQDRGAAGGGSRGPQGGTGGQGDGREPTGPQAPDREERRDPVRAPGAPGLPDVRNQVPDDALPDPNPPRNPGNPGGPGAPGGPGSPGGPGNPDSPGGPGNPDGTQPPDPTPTDPTPTDPTDPTPTDPTPTDPTPTEPDPTEEPALVQAPTGVTATLVGEGVVRVSWTHAGPAADSFGIYLSGDDTALTTVAGAAREADINVTPGQEVRFVVFANGPENRAASAASNAVVASGRPGAPGGVGGSVAPGAWNAGSVAATVTWTPAPANGSAITGYTVRISGGSPSGTQTTTVGAGATQATFSVPCADTGNEDCDSGVVTASVTAVNGQGTGQEASAQISGGVSSVPRLPAGSAQHVTGDDSGQTIGPEGMGASTTLSLAPPADWAAFPGRCLAIVDGAERDIACGATSLTVAHDYPHYPMTRCDRFGGPGGGAGTMTHSHTVVFVADNGRNRVQSAAHGWSNRQQLWCDDMAIP